MIFRPKIYHAEGALRENIFEMFRSLSNHGVPIRLHFSCGRYSYRKKQEAHGRRLKLYARTNRPPYVPSQRSIRYRRVSGHTPQTRINMIFNKVAWIHRRRIRLGFSSSAVNMPSAGSSVAVKCAIMRGRGQNYSVWHID